MDYTCPCCGYKTLYEEPPGTYDICHICFWEDDGVQFSNSDYEGGANTVSLRQAQQNFIRHGFSDLVFKDCVRTPNENDVKTQIGGLFLKNEHTKTASTHMQKRLFL